MARKTKKKNLNTFITIVIAALLIGVVVFGILVMIKQNQLGKITEKEDSRDTNTASTIIRTEEDLKDEEKVTESSNDAKDKIEAEKRNQEKDAQTSTQTESGLKVATPDITFVAPENDLVAVGGEVRNINKNEGSCIAVFIKDGVVVTASSEVSLTGSGYISCKTIKIEKSKLSAGTWSVKLQYKSNYAEGESESQDYTVQ